ncbi:MAG: hypothetical protein FWD79_08925 [Desulfobulbus sp.]|nr:hypothetical protein [Desulfobulbus sp.]
MPVADPGLVFLVHWHAPSEPVLLNIIENFLKFNGSERKRTSAAKQHYFNMLVDCYGRKYQRGYFRPAALIRALEDDS